MTTTFSVELEVAPEVFTYGEYTEVTDSRAAVLLLHDHGADLDSVRPFVWPLQRLLIDTCIVDMPGHGLSGGNWQEHASGAVTLALELCSKRAVSTAVLAVGAAGNLLFSLPSPAVQAVALVEPGLTLADLRSAEPWRTVPLIAMGDPTDQLTQDGIERLGSWVRAWSMGLYVHYQVEAGVDSAPWTEHMTHSAAAFVAEQLAYHNLSQGAVRSGAISLPD